MTTPPPYQSHGSADDFLMGGGVKSASFDGVAPLAHSGTIVEFGKQQKRDFDTNEPLFWGDGKPKEVLRVTIQTDQRDPSDPEDDGQRALYLEWKKAHAVRDAIKQAGASGLEVGATLSLTWVSGGERQAGQKGFTPKEYRAEYRSPAAPAADPWSGVAGLPAQPQQPAVQQAPPPVWQQPAPAPAPVQTVDPQLVAYLQSKGIDTAGLDQARAEMIAKALPS